MTDKYVEQAREKIPAYVQCPRCGRRMEEDFRPGFYGCDTGCDVVWYELKCDPCGLQVNDHEFHSVDVYSTDENATLWKEFRECAMTEVRQTISKGVVQ